MPYILVNSWYPPHLADKVAKRYLELLQKNPIPDYVKRLIPAASRATIDGINVMNVDEVKKDKLGDAYEYAVKFMLGFRDIEGFRYEIVTLTTVADALKFIGMGT